jgi:hypothetical protein
MQGQRGVEVRSFELTRAPQSWMRLFGRRGRGGRIGKAFGGFAGGWVAFQKAIGMSQFQNAVDHPGGAGQAKSAASRFHAREAVDNFPQATAVEFSQLGEIENYLSLPVAEQLIQGEFQLLALDAHLERTAQFENHDPWLELFFYDLHKNPSERRLILERIAESLQERAK